VSTGPTTGISALPLLLSSLCGAGKYVTIKPQRPERSRGSAEKDGLNERFFFENLEAH